MAHRWPMSGAISIRSRHVPFRSRGARLLLAGGCADRLCESGRALSCSSAASNLLNQHYQDVFSYRTERARFMPACGLAAVKSGGGRIGDHRREARLGGELAIDASPGRRTCRRSTRFWTNSTSSRSSTPGSTGCAELRAFDRHEIDELAGVRRGRAPRPRGRRRPAPAPRRSARPA